MLDRLPKNDMCIYWWDTDKAVAKLADGCVSERESMGYAMVSAFLLSQGVYYAIWFGGNTSWLVLYEFFVVMVVSLVGIHVSFTANGGGAGNDFLKRLSVISVPVGIKVAIASTVVGQAAYHGFPYVVTTANFRDPVHVYQMFCFASAIAVTSIFYWRLTTHFARLVGRQQANTLDQVKLRVEVAPYE